MPRVVGEFIMLLGNILAIEIITRKQIFFQLLSGQAQSNEECLRIQA